jgi:membrane fusion protein, copper/silver efflux system
MKFLGVIILLISAFSGGIAVQKYVLNSADFAALTGGEAEAPGENEPLYWVAPMDKNYKRDKPGTSPMGMDLIPVYKDDNQGADEGGVKISPVVENNLGVRTALVKRAPFDLQIETVGYVSFDEDTLTHIHSRVDGWIEVLTVTSEGDPVKKGQTLYELYSPALVNAQEEFLAALRSNNRSLKKASRSRLLSLGFTTPQINRLEKRRKVDQRIKETASQNGIVKTLNVREGMFINPSTDIMSVGSLDTVWVIAEVFERQSNWVKQGQKVEMTAEALPGQTWMGTVDYLYPVLDAKTRTLRVRIRFDNPDYALKPNMFANLRIKAPVAENTLSIPKEALIRGGRYNRVVLSQGEGRFKSVLVKSGIEAGKNIQILEGLNEGDKVVTSAQFLIDSESNIDAELARMEDRNNEDSAGSEQNSAPKMVTATGKVKQLMTDMAMITIAHDPIEAWEWPSMSMTFTLSEPDQVPDINSGDRIEFHLSETDEGDYLVSRIKRLTPATKKAATSN